MNFFLMLKNSESGHSKVLSVQQHLFLSGIIHPLHAETEKRRESYPCMQRLKSPGPHGWAQSLDWSPECCIPSPTDWLAGSGMVTWPHKLIRTFPESFPGVRKELCISMRSAAYKVLSCHGLSCVERTFLKMSPVWRKTKRRDREIRVSHYYYYYFLA